MNTHAEMKMFKNLALFITIIAAVWTNSWAKPSPQMQPEEFWLTVPSSPLDARFSPSKRDIELLNRSSGKVIRYRLGCVMQETNKARVVQRMPFIDVDLEGGKVLINSANRYDDDLVRCGKKKSRLAVVEVLFEDNSVWKAR